MTRHCAAAGCTNELPHWLRADAVYCSVACRMKTMREKAKGTTIAVTGRGYTGVTDNPHPAPPARALPALSQAELDAKFPIPEDLTIPKWLRRESDAPHWKLLDPEA